MVIAKIEAEPGSWQLSSLAAFVSVSKSHLRHLFRKETGTTLKRYLKTQRLKRAALLLTTTFWSVKEIMARVGYRSGGHFLREFKSAYGMTPTAYRDRFGLDRNRHQTEA